MIYVDTEYHVLMSDMPLYQVIISKHTDLHNALKEARRLQKSSVPYQNFYVQQWDSINGYSKEIKK